MKILLFKHQTDAQKLVNQCTIYCRINFDYKSKEIGSTGVSCDFDHFDLVKSVVTESDVHHREKNLLIAEKTVRPLNQIYLNMIMNNDKISVDQIKARFKYTFVSPVHFMAMFDDFIQSYLNEPKKDGGKRSESTLIPLNVAFNQVTTYLKQKKQLNVKIHEIDMTLYEDFSLYLFRKGFKVSYRNKQRKIFLQVYRWGIKKYKLRNDLQDAHVERDKKNKPIKLKHEQFEIWRKFKFSRKIMQETADLFTLYSRTALNYSDLKEIHKEPSAFIQVGLDGRSWIYKDREKTEITSKIPIDAFPEVAEIINKYGGWDKLPMKPNQKLNDWLKICVAEINLTLPAELQINPGLSVKHGRKTFCDWWINERGENNESLLPIMGRVSDYGLDAYVNPDERAVIAALKRQSLLAS